MLDDSEQRILNRVLSRQSAETAPDLFSCGDRIGPWHVQALLGRGGSGEVYRVVHGETAEVAAAKVLVKKEAAAARRFAEEISFLKMNQGPLFARFIESGTVEERPYFITELLEPLEWPKGERAIADYLLSVCACVSALHRLGMVHRDLKPKNIMRRVRSGGESAELVLIDFGLAKPAAAAPRNDLSTLSGRVVGVGTPGYAAPEQMMGDAVSPLADIHALGRIANDAFGGKPPRTWAEIIRRSTSSIPAQRYSSVDELASAIRHRNRGRRRRVARMLVAMLLVAALGVLAWRNLARPAPIVSEKAEEEAAWKALCETITTNRVTKELLRTHWETNRVVIGSESFDVARPSVSDYRFQTNAVDVILVRLNQKELRFLYPIELEGGREYLVVGPGILDGELVCREGRAMVGLKDCFLLNRTTQEFEEAGIDYRLWGGAYLNFTRLDYSVTREFAKYIRRDADGENNLVRFHGPETSEGLYQSLDAELWRQLSKDL